MGSEMSFVIYCYCIFLKRDVLKVATPSPDVQCSVASLIACMMPSILFWFGSFGFCVSFCSYSYHPAGAHRKTDNKLPAVYFHDLPLLELQKAHRQDRLACYSISR